VQTGINLVLLAGGAVVLNAVLGVPVGVAAALAFVASIVVAFVLKIRRQLGVRNVRGGMTKNGPERARVQLGMIGNGESLTNSMLDSAQLHMASASADRRESETLKNGDDLMP